jgi:hypothetical protein
MGLVHVALGLRREFDRALDIVAISGLDVLRRISKDVYQVDTR